MSKIYKVKYHDWISERDSKHIMQTWAEYSGLVRDMPQEISEFVCPDYVDNPEDKDYCVVWEE